MTQIISPAPNKNLKKFNKATAMVTKVVTKLSTIRNIESKEQADRAIIIMKDAKGIEKMIEDKRTELVKPLNDTVKQINEFSKGLMAQISTGVDAGKKTVIAYQKAEEEKAEKLKVEVRTQQLIGLSMIEDGSLYRYESFVIPKNLVSNSDETTWKALVDDLVDYIQQAKNKTVEALKEDSDFLEAFGSDDDKVEIQERIATAAIPVRYGSTSFISAPAKLKGQTKNWKFTVTDPSQVPREYMTVDDVKIRAAIAKGERLIAGVNIFQEDNLTLR